MVSTARIAFAALIVTSCGGGTNSIRDRGDRGQPPPAYMAHDAELFDDAIEPSALGEAGEATLKPARTDMILRERTQIGDAALRAKVITVTARDENAGRSWLLGLQTLETLAGRRPPGSEFVVQVDAAGPAAGMVRAMEGRLVGMTFVAFVREYRAPPVAAAAAAAPTGEADGDGSRWHFHLARDDKSEVAAVREAAALGEVR